jgi:hypothetical protein
MKRGYQKPQMLIGSKRRAFVGTDWLDVGCCGHYSIPSFRRLHIQNQTVARRHSQACSL